MEGVAVVHVMLRASVTHSSASAVLRHPPPYCVQAKLAEEAERYEDMVQNVKALAELNVQLNVEVRVHPPLWARTRARHTPSVTALLL
ncbi:hypothetical protein EON62_06285 [archaeon]|nr:MAG: hypothetical protein EON62_06285 [archaeon]